jgi:hypothetical protein
MTGPGDEHVAAHLLDSGAHAMRNDLATLHMAASLVDDDEVATSMAAAVADLRVRIERAVVAARIELGARPDDVTLDAEELLRIGTARARREGVAEPLGQVELDGSSITGPGPWLERLVADALHADDEAWLAILARACGCVVESEGGALRVCGFNAPL